MSLPCINCGVFFGPAFVSLVLIIGGLSSEILDWRDLKDRKVIIPEIGVVLLVVSFVLMIIELFQYEEIDYLPFFAPGLVGLAITSVGVYRIRHDVNFTGANYAYTGIALFSGSLLWIVWVLEAFS